MAAKTALILLVFIAAVGACSFVSALLLQEHMSRALNKSKAGVFRAKQPLAWLTSTLQTSKIGTRLGAKRRKRALRDCMPEALRLISSSLSSGSSITQAFQYAAKHCSSPLKEEFEHAVWDMEAGRSFSESMEGLRKRTGGAELSYLAVAMEIQHMSGGSLNETIEAVSDSLRQTAELEDELKTKTAQGRLSARIVSAMPIALLVVMSLFSQGYASMFFENAFGVVLFVLALLLEVLGVIMVRRVLSVDIAAGTGGAT